MSDFLEKILEDPLIEVGADMDLEEFAKLYKEKREKVMKKLREDNMNERYDRQDQITKLGVKNLPNHQVL